MTISQTIDKAFKYRFSIAWAYIIKEMKNLFRFKLSIFNFIFNPFLTMISFFLVYSAVFFVGDVNDLGYVQQSNYVVYLLTGFLAYSCFTISWRKTSMQEEKIMLTLEGILLTPRSRLYIMVGKGAKALFEIFLVILIFVALMLFIQPAVEWHQLLIGSAALMLVLIIFMSIDFVISSIGLAEEGLAAILATYGPRAFLIVSCVYYPIETIPEYLRFLAYANPAYYGVNLFRDAFMPAELPFGVWGPMLYLLILAVLMPMLSVYVFEFILKKWGIKGY